MTNGLHKHCIILDKYVIKFPKSILKITDIYSEQYGYITCGKRFRKYLCPSYFIPFIPIIIQPKANVLNTSNDKEYYHLKRLCWRITENQIGKFGVFTDSKPNNFGYYKGKLVKIDFGFDYYWYNFKIDIFGYNPKENIENSLRKHIILKIKKFIRSVK